MMSEMYGSTSDVYKRQAWGNIAIDKNANSEELANVESFNVLVEADAIQADGFANAAAAFTAFDAK